jgi:ABC-type glycerol-3-phosphate transport system substrate-binding protein
MTMASGFVTAALLTVLLGLAPAARAADYGGPLIDAHSHVPNATAIDAYVAAMKRHNVVKVVLLGVGGRQKDDTIWLTAASKKYPDRVVAGLPLPDPTRSRRRASSKSSSSAGGRG